MRILLEEDSGARHTVAVALSFDWTVQDREDIRWYLEDYPGYLSDPAPRIAERIEMRMAELGGNLFTALFLRCEGARHMWHSVRDLLDNVRIEIVAGVGSASLLPWELLRDPQRGTWLVLAARAFVRSTEEYGATATTSVEGPLRILLVICRPGGAQDVPFRSVGGQLVKMLNGPAPIPFELSVLRPPTFERLCEVLKEAKEQGRSYHIVHFDGHGGYHRYESGVGYGYLVFEGTSSTADEPNQRAIDTRAPMPYPTQRVRGRAIGEVLADAGVSLLVLNACRSAHADAPSAPEQMEAGDVARTVNAGSRTARAFSSLAQDVISAGVAGVVAMRYNVYVVTAAQFVANLYTVLAGGESLADAVTAARRDLVGRSQREIAYHERDLQDWQVPALFEATPVVFASRSMGEPLEQRGGVRTTRAILPPDLPPAPDHGFIGRDETILALDRAFDVHNVVLLHAYAGSGKTLAAAEFARWYQATGGIGGRVLFTSFERYTPLARLLATMEETLSDVFRANGIEWLAYSHDERRTEAIRLLREIPVLWIWDNVESITWHGVGLSPSLNDVEQRELLEFLREASATSGAANNGTRFLLTSRRDEREWLGDLAKRIAMSSMPFSDTVRLARMLAAQRGKKLNDLAIWRPLLRFMAGSPLTVTVLVAQALRDGLTTKEEFERFVAQLRSGEAAFHDDEREGRRRSLGAALAYGFEHAFTAEERKYLVLLYLFQRVVDVQVLSRMVDYLSGGHVPDLSAIDAQSLTALLDRAVDVGTLDKRDDGMYTIHPAVPWFFRQAFDALYPDSLGDSDAGPRSCVVQAYIDAMVAVGARWVRRYRRGSATAISILRYEEDNLVHAYGLACDRGWHRRMIGTAECLMDLYDHCGRWAEFELLLRNVVTEFNDLETGEPLPGQEAEWSAVKGFQAWLALLKRDADQVLRLRSSLAEHAQQRAAPFISVPLESLMPEQRDALLAWGDALHQLGVAQLMCNRSECASSFSGAFAVLDRFSDQPRGHATAYMLGVTYRRVEDLRDLDKSEYWFRRTLQVCDKRDEITPAKCWGELGGVAYERVREGIESGMPQDELMMHRRIAEKCYNEALYLTRPSIADDQSLVGTDCASYHFELGRLYYEMNDIEESLRHCRACLRFDESVLDSYLVAQAQTVAAKCLAERNCFVEACEYVRAALNRLAVFGDQVQKEREELLALSALMGC